MIELDTLPKEVLRLVELIGCNQFEIVDFENLPHTKNGTDCKVVYLMNDAVESFVVLKNARYTGEYIKEYRGDLMWDLSLTDDGYALRICQGESHIMLFFDSCEMENNLYNYGQTGHFWVKGFEYLRVMEYQIAIIRDKYDYLGEECCNEEEIRLAELRNFPPLNYVSWPSSDAEYIVPLDNPYDVSQKAVRYLIELAYFVNDEKMVSELKKYAAKPTIRSTARLARKLTLIRHGKFVDMIARKIRSAAGQYPNRFKHDLDDVNDIAIQNCLRGRPTSVFYEEPFKCQKDGITFKVYLMFWKNRHKRRYVDVKIVK